ncbi:ABC transporter substrate-binding protein [Agromyces salentinus]|uniref:ABC transporter substrate-binding protein n=1 Tax=Agromyces salentinus TaxID=269421 RepID=A0ABN2MHR8_9MICO|nr:sugar ABC transporter substrate-binding protein [Agromyces salentinus]
MRSTQHAGIAFAAAAALALVGCSPSAETTAAVPEYDEPVDLTMTLWTADEAIIDQFQARADAFREENPELGELTIETIPFAEYNSQLAIRLSGGEAPDLGWIVESATPAWVDSGALADVSSLEADEDWAYDDIIPNLITALEGEDGELYGYPFAGTTHPIVYNATAFEAAGLETPNELLAKGEWTWDALREQAKALVDAGVVTYGFDIPQWGYTSYALFTPFMKAFGAEAYPDGETCGYADEASVETFEFVHDMVFEDGSYPAPGSASSFPTGDTGMYLGAPSTLAQLADSTFEYDMAPQPEGEVEYSPFIGQASMVVFADGKAPELATRLFGFLTSEEGSAALPYVAPRASLQTEEFVAGLYPQVPAESAKASLLDTLDVAEQLDYPVAFPELETATKPIFDGVWQPDADIQAVLEEVCATADPILQSQ